MKFPKVTIITVCFNSEQTIRETIESVLSQDYPNIEYIIIDGLSNDKTKEIVLEYREKIHNFISERDFGIYDAMNKGILVATGDIIGILNSDDIYVDKSAVSELIEKMQVAKSDCVFADLVVTDRNDINKVLRYYDSSHFSPNKFRYGWMPAHPTFFVKKKIYEKVGLYSLKYLIAADYEMLIRILWVERSSYEYLPKPMVKMRIGGASSRNLFRIWILNREIVKACKENGIYTNILFVALKIPQKIFGLFVKS